MVCDNVWDLPIGFPSGSLCWMLLKGAREDPTAAATSAVVNLATIEHWEPEGSLLTRFCLLHGKRRVCFAVQSLGLLFRRSLVQVDLVVGARALRLVRPKTKGSRLSGPLARPLLR